MLLFFSFLFVATSQAQSFGPSPIDIQKKPWRVYYWDGQQISHDRVMNLAEGVGVAQDNVIVYNIVSYAELGLYSVGLTALANGIVFTGIYGLGWIWLPAIGAGITLLAVPFSLVSLYQVKTAAEEYNKALGREIGMRHGTRLDLSASPAGIGLTLTF